MAGRRLFQLGLSPRVRGNPVVLAHLFPHHGSIPARAGEPEHGPAAHSLIRVYPRACGGTWEDTLDTYYIEGLSPRVRGNPLVSAAQIRESGSIRARAGEPGASAKTNPKTGVYPRACGGTATKSAPYYAGLGLSPRVRGNPDAVESLAGHVGSIPARAGEPS